MSRELANMVPLLRPKHVFALLRVLAAAIGSSYLETAVETYVSLLSANIFRAHWISFQSADQSRIYGP